MSFGDLFASFTPKPHHQYFCVAYGTRLALVDYEYHQLSFYVCISTDRNATPTLLKLKTMKGADGKSLKIIETVAAGDYKTFGMSLLQDENGEQVKLIKKDNEGAKDITEEILQKWLTSGAAPTRTYQHLIECLRQSELGALAEKIAAITLTVESK